LGARGRQGQAWLFRYAAQVRACLLVIIVVHYHTWRGTREWCVIMGLEIVSLSQSGCIPVFERGLEARDHPTQLPNNESAWSSFQRTNANPFLRTFCSSALHRFLYMFRLNPCLQAGCSALPGSAFRLCSAPATQLPTMSHYPTFQTRGSGY
jgi:hypothetical protein